MALGKALSRVKAMRRPAGRLPSGRAFEINEAAVAQAARQLDIEGPVRVRIVRYRNDKSGRYVGVRDGVVTVSVSSDLDADEASRTIWHELTHARQAQAQALGSDGAFDRRWEAE